MVGVLEIDTSELLSTPIDNSFVSSKMSIEMIVRNVATKVEYRIATTREDRTFSLVAPLGEYQIIELSSGTTRKSQSPAFKKHLAGSDYFTLGPNRVCDLGVFVWKISEVGRTYFFLRQRTTKESTALRHEIEKSAWKSFDIDDANLHRYLGTEKFFYPKAGAVQTDGESSSK